MKKMIIGIFTILLGTGAAYCQKDNTDIDIVQSLNGRSKRMIVNEFIQLDAKEEESFWNIYNQYEEKRKAIEKRSFILLKKYADNYQTLDAAEAHSLAMDYLESIEESNNLHKIYFKKMERATGSLKAARFIQLESYIQTEQQANLQSQVPLIGEKKLIDGQKVKIDGQNVNL
jgi:hypothetical protein